mgnify:CR=1 FL=1
MNSTVSLAVTPDGRRVVVSRVIDAPLEDVWTLFVEPQYWPEWGPSVTAIDCPDRRIRTGSTGRLRIVGRLWVPFEVTNCDDHRWAWRVAGTPATGHRVAADDDGSLASFEVPVWAVPYVLVCDRALARFEDLAAGIGDRRY